MFIEELIIDGFKSYSSRTYVGPFDKQFNAITGLNGSGKSNILDSICFVLGISNLSQVRVGNLSELVYKQGQAGVTKASVTVVFNNEDKSCSPVGYEMHDRINITRQIVIGGRNRYILNSHNVQANQIQNLFHSVSLNVNNPHFLIMQGRITKVINMKPQETLSMIEEAAGTRMYENKKVTALKTLEKKQNKVDEINRLLSEEITPTLEKLQKERTNYMLWASNNNEIERLLRFCTAHEYVQALNRMTNKNTQLEQMEQGLATLGADIAALLAREAQIKTERDSGTSKLDKQRSETLAAMEAEFEKLSKKVVSIESKLKNRQSDLEALLEGRKKTQAQTDETRKQLEAKERVWQKEQAKWDKLAEEQAAVQKDIDRAQWAMQALTAGMSAKEPESEGESTSMREQLLAAQTRLSEMEADKKKKSMAIEHLSGRMGAAQEKVNKTKKEGQRMLKEKSLTENHVTSKREELGKLGFNRENFGALEEQTQRAEAALQATQERLDGLRAYLGGVDFTYSDPHRGFNRASVKGVVAKLFHIKPDFAEYHRALEVSAGGRLFSVVVDNEETGKALLDRGQLRRRVVIIPLNKIVGHTIAPQVVKTAHEVAPSGAALYPALEIIGFDKQVQNAMKYVFGHYIICDGPETAKKVTFHPSVRVHSVTKDGDVYDPNGTLSGGSAPRGGGVLVKLQELAQLEQQAQQQQREAATSRKQLEQLRAGSQRHASVEQELRVKEHELELLEERIKHSEHHTAEQALQEMQAYVAQCKADIEALPEERKQLEQKVRQLEKEIKSLESTREGRIEHLEKKVEQLKGALAQKAEKLDAQRERTEQASVELEVMKGEVLSQESKDEESGQSNSTLQAEVDDLGKQLEKQQGSCSAAEAKIKSLRGEIDQLSEALAALAAELSAKTQEREDKQLEQKRLSHRVEQLQKDDKEVHLVVARMEKQHAWIEKEKTFFGKAGTDFDFEANSYVDERKRLDDLQVQQKSLSKNINKKAMAMFEKAEQEYQDLLQKRDIILNDKRKIEQVIGDLDEKKIETLRRTWAKVNKDFDSIFSTLLPFTNAKLEAPQGMDETEGLEIKVAFHGVWKHSLTELSGGQRSLLALSLVLALLLFKPAPMYILDEIDSALDLSHTQNIGHMIRTHFPHSQFIVVSLKEGMFNNANVLFRTRFVAPTSTVTRYAIRDADDAIDMTEKDKEHAAKQQSRKRKGGEA